MAMIVPAILETTKEGFLDKMSRILKLSGIERIHIDFGDGKFVKTKTLDVSEIDTLNPAFHFEAHLMTENPTDFLDYKICGFKTIILHYEAYKNISGLKDAIAKIKASAMEPSVAINPDTRIDVLKTLENKVKHFQIMSVIPGLQGQEFVGDSLERVKELREILPNAIIEMDGGINETNIKFMPLAGVGYVVVGSALVGGGNIADNYARLQEAMMSEVTDYNP